MKNPKSISLSVFLPLAYKDKIKFDMPKTMDEQLVKQNCVICYLNKDLN